jgi:hypothetical protein
LGIALAAGLTWRWSQGTKDAPSPRSAEQAAAATDQLQQQLIERHLSSAEAKSLSAVDPHVDTVRRFFRQSQRNTPAFARAALAWGSKWRLVADRLDRSGGQRQLEYLRTKFDELVFSPEQVERVISQAIHEYLQDLRSIESQMLVDLRADLANFPSSAALAQRAPGDWQAEFDRAIRQAIAASSGQLQADVNSQIVSIISAELLTQVAVRLGVSAGILGVGAASSWATFGVGVVVGLIVDQIVMRIWNWWADPADDLAHELNHQLDELQGLLCDGDHEVVGLRARLQQLARDRAALRRQVIDRLWRGPIEEGR